ncbi:MAG TPA: hypothetical protein VFA07_13970 [Chthonomonadaceae bacterium]|nr:hypothetical protein [Chthonomonadaceae bacterium]
MITRRSLLASAALGLAAPMHHAQSTGKKVFLGLSKDIALQGVDKILAFYQCNTANVPCSGPRGIVNMEEFSVIMKGPMASHAPCDEITENGGFSLKWTCLVRADPNTAGGFTIFGLHKGTFIYSDTCGNVAKGTMEGTINCGTHRAPTSETCEACRQQMHFEGLLKGKCVSGPLFNQYGSIGGALLEATYSGDVSPDWPIPGTSTGIGAVMALDGVYILPCQ